MMHHMRNRRFGDPAVSACLRKTELKPFLAEVRRLCMRGDKEKTTHVFEAIQARMRNLAESTLAERLAHAVRGPKRLQQAEQEIARVTAEANPVEAAHLIGALFLLRERMPGRWPTERAFRFELVRSWRKLAGIAYGTCWNHQRGKLRRMYKEMPPTVVEALAEWLVIAYTPLVARLSAAANADANQPKTFRDALAEAFWPSAVQSLLAASGVK